jgi:hypothetical protein
MYLDANIASRYIHRAFLSALDAGPVIPEMDAFMAAVEREERWPPSATTRPSQPPPGNGLGPWVVGIVGRGFCVRVS